MSEEVQAEVVPVEAASEPVEEILESTTSTDEGDVNSPGEETTEKPRAKGVQKRIDELVSQRQTEQEAKEHAQAEAEFLRKQVERMQTPEKAPTPVEIELPKVPNPLSFDSDEDYQAAAQDYSKQMYGLAQKAVTDGAQQAQAQTAHQQAQTAFDQRAAAFAQTVPDYQAVVTDPSVPISNEMAEVLRNSEAGPQMAYYLAKNKVDAYRIANLPAGAQAYELGKLEAKAALPNVKNISSAPTPIKPLAGGGEATKVDPDTLPIDEWMAKRGAGEIR